MNQFTPLHIMRFFIFFIAIFPSWAAFAQIEQVQIEGKSYYVYPHQIAVADFKDFFMPFVDYKEVIKRDSVNEKIVSITEVPVEKWEKEYGNMYFKSSKKYQKEMMSFLENDESFLIQIAHDIHTDPTPALRQLPDGDYVIYYRDIPQISNRVLRYRNDLIAAFISIQNNEIEGESKWLYPKQDQIYMTGSYRGSEKEGEWKMYTYEFNEEKTPSYDSKKGSNAYLKSIVYDTITATFHFNNGLKNGKYTLYRNGDLLRLGHYENDKKIGLWESYDYKEEIVFDSKGQLSTKNTGELYLSERYTLRSDKQRGKGVLIRTNVVPYEMFEYDFEEEGNSLVLTNSYSAPSDYDDEYDYFELFADFSSFYSIIDEDTNDLELLEEGYGSYEGSEYYYNESIDYEFYEKDYNPNENYITCNGKRYRVNDLIDSIGYLYKYEGVVEKYYSNGQLQYRFEVKNGQLVKEEPVYWDNGQVANEILFVEDSNQYVQRFYDYNGKLYQESWYDHKGNALQVSENRFERKVTIGERTYERNYGNPTYFYSSDKELGLDSLVERVLVMEDVFKVDSSLASQSWYYPSEKMLRTTQQNLMHHDVGYENIQFSDDFQNININRFIKYGDLELRTIKNGYLVDYYKDQLTDTSILEKLVYNWYYKYSGESTNELWANGKVFTGSFKLVDEQSKLKVKAKDHAITISLPNNVKDYKLYKSSISKYKKSGKKNSILEGYTDDFGGTNFLSRAVLKVVPHVYQIFRRYNDENHYDLDGYDDDKVKPTKKDKKISRYTSIEGQYLNGKPEGIWTYKDQFGKIRSIVSYKDGQLHGVNTYHQIANPKQKTKKSKKSEEYYYAYVDPMEKYRTYPDKKTYYTEITQNFKNGLLDGDYIKQNWKGDTLNYVRYSEGQKVGREYTRNILIYTESYYENGVVDGKVKTYLTIPQRDTILLFDLGFKNGLLQGESVAYHTNGKIAKKGFFLMGQPIDDYQAFDTLGNIYQYVKFQYNQPVEEKIWEENELSIRYLFDWRDSIPFYFADITASSSAERLLYEIGYRDNSLHMPYYGRPSLVNKTGITYDITKYYPNDTVARTGTISKGVKKGCWMYYNYEGKKLCEVEYFDTIIKVNDSIRFKSKGILYYVDENNEPLSKSYIIEKFEKYDCSHTDHNEERMLYCFWEKDTNQHRINGYVKNYYDNGSLQNEGMVKDGLPTGVWKMYDVNGNLNQVGEYVMGKRNGRWLKGDLGSVKNMSEICLNPNLENLEAILSYQEKLLDISVITYKLGKELKRKYYGINRNNEEAPEGYEDYEYYYEGGY